MMEGQAPAGERIIAAELAALPAGARVLSVGEGTGRHVVGLGRAFPDLMFFAFDLDPATVRAADRLRIDQGVHNVRFFVGDACRLPLKRAIVDFAYVRSVLQFLGDLPEHQREMARVTRGVIVYRDTQNWPFYRPLRWLQATTLRLRRKQGWIVVMRDAALAHRTATTHGHATWYARSFRDTGLFSEVRVIGHDILWWDADRDVPVVGSFGARFGLRCAVAAERSRGSHR